MKIEISIDNFEDSFDFIADLFDLISHHSLFFSELKDKNNRIIKFFVGDDVFAFQEERSHCMRLGGSICSCDEKECKTIKEVSKCLSKTGSK